MLFYLLSADELGEIFARLGYDYDDGTIPRTSTTTSSGPRTARR